MTAGTGRGALLTLGLLAACGREEPDFEVGRVGVVLRSDAAFARRPDLPDRLARTVGVALRYWGGTWDDLAGATIVLEGSPHVRCGAETGASGCWDGDVRISTRDPAFVFSCIEQTTLVHEVGHAVVGDPRHRDPRWRDFAAVERALSGARGYPPDGGEGPCQLYPGVWRHPRG
jgi:hypothetical protein